MTTDVRAGIYCRISKADDDDRTKVDDQERICRDLADRIGWQVIDVYPDQSKSAWQRNRKRLEWDRMLRDVDTGRINGIIVYHGDRLYRRGQDLAKLLDLAETKGVKLASPTGTKDLDTERFELWIRAAVAEEESQRLSERRKAQYERWRRQGMVRSGGNGGRAFGWDTRNQPHPAEYELIREAARRIIGGEANAAICRDFAARGIATPAGNPLNGGALRRLLLKPRIAGLMPDGVSTAAWEPAIPRDEWEMLCAVLTARGHKHNPKARRNYGRKYLLSGIAACGVCGSRLQTSDNGNQRGYACRKPGCYGVYRSIELLDAYVARRVTNRLSHEANPQPRTPDDPVEASELVALTAARAEVEQLLADYTGGNAKWLLARLDSIDRRLTELRAVASDDARSRLLTRYAGLSYDEFCGLPLSVRRSLVTACFDITVLPASKHGPGFRTEDVRLEPR